MSDGAQVEVGELTERDRIRRRTIAKAARNFLVRLDALGRLLAMHHEDNDAVVELLEKASIDLRELQAKTGEAAFVFTEGHSFVNGVWVRSTQRAWEAGKRLTERLAQLKGRGMVLEDKLSSDSLLALSRLTRKGTNLPELFDVPGVRLLPAASDADLARMGRARQRELAVDLFREGLITISARDLQELDLYMRRRQRALCQALISLAEDSTEDLLALTTIREPRLPAQAHTLMVTVLAIALGRALDMPRRELLRLAIAALSHNMGEAFINPKAFALPREYNDKERRFVQRHALLGFKHQLKTYGLQGPALDRAVACAEHHLHVDGKGGYPYKTRARPHLFSRIIGVADVYLALCADRPHRTGYTPDQAMKLALRLRGKQFDRPLLKLLVRVVGRYPPGSLVELDTGAWAVVIGPGAGQFPLERPKVLLISDEDGYELAQPIEVDLGERHGRRKAWLRTIARTRDPRATGIEVHKFLFSDRVEVPPVKLDHDVKKRRRAPEDGQKP